MSGSEGSGAPIPKKYSGTTEVIYVLFVCGEGFSPISSECSLCAVSGGRLGICPLTAAMASEMGPSCDGPECREELPS